MGEVELKSRVPEEGNLINGSQVCVGLTEAPTDGVLGPGDIMLYSGEALFENRGHDFAVAEQAGR